MGGTWVITTIAGLYAGHSERTTGADEGSKTLMDRGREAIAIVAPYVFMAGVFVLIAWGIHELVSPAARTDLRHAGPATITLPGIPNNVALTVGQPGGGPYSHFEARRATYAADLARASVGRWSPDAIDLYNLSMLLWTAVIAGGLLAWRVDINEFSMHHFYKNRLVRCYLGAARNRRKPDAFTGFDAGDDFPIASLGSRPGLTRDQVATDVYCGPYPIMNAALNLAGGNALAWQERQAASYVFTPHFSGYEKTLVDRESGVTGKSSLTTEHAYRRTATCAYKGGIGIGTAMAVSGAAASPNSGYHTSTPVAFFLTLLNARLGWWLGNPGHTKRYRNSSPELGLPYLLVELFGLANTNRGYVNLSDGGHFENLGIYELVRRRCKYVIACDGEQDGRLTFGGLAGAIRKCRADFGVHIDINVDRLRLNDDRLSAAHCVVGTIKYPGGTDGYLLYVKSCLTGNEDPDVLEYRSRNRSFPHESTGDQWFDESQFESYRTLGLHVAESVFSVVGALDEPDRAATYAERKESFFRDLAIMHHPPSKTIRQSFTRHTETLSRLLASFAAEDKFVGLDESIFSRWTTIEKKELEKQYDRPALYWCISIIQLMENVYVDLDLEDAKERLHPDNAGWLRLFQRWAVTPVFRRTWAIVASTYGERFQRFFESLQIDEVSRVSGTWVPAPTAPVTIGALSIAEIALTRDGRGDLTGTVTLKDGPVDLTEIDFNGARLVFTCHHGGEKCALRLSFDDVLLPRRAWLGSNDATDQRLSLFSRGNPWP